MFGFSGTVLPIFIFCWAWKCATLLSTLLVWQIVKIDMILFTVTQKTCYFTNLALEGVHESEPARPSGFRPGSALSGPV